MVGSSCFGVRVDFSLCKALSEPRVGEASISSRHFCNSYWRDLEKELSKYDSLVKWVEVARETNAHYYHYDSLRWYPFNGEREWDATTVHANIVGLSLDGKIGMEYYYEIFAFFTRLLRDRLSQFRLADSLLVHITE